MFERFSAEKAKAYIALLAEARKKGISEKEIALSRFCNYCRTDDKRYRLFQKCTFEQVRKAFDAFLEREYLGIFRGYDFSDEELLGAFKQYYKPQYIAHLLREKE